MERNGIRECGKRIGRAVGRAPHERCRIW